MLPDIVFTLQPDSHCDYLSSHFGEITGLPSVAGLREGWLDALHPDDRPRLHKEVCEALAAGTECESCCRLKTATGCYRRFVSRLRPLRDQAGRVLRWLGILMDVHDLEAAENALQQVSRQKEEFLATLIHDVRNPLAPIHNALELLRLAATPEPVRQRALDIINRQVHELTRLMDDLTNASRLARGKIELRKNSFRLDELVSRAVEISRPWIEERRHHLAVMVAEEPILLKGDLERLVQAVANLLSNAARYTEEGGRIVLAAHAAEEEVVLRVQDDGQGIAAEMLPHVFEMFFRADTTRRGLGLGLAIVQKMVKLHGGTVQAFSAGPGCGSDFVIRLPHLTDPEKAAAAPQKALDALRKMPGRRIVLVTDRQDFAEEWSLLLRVAGHEVRTLTSAAPLLETGRAFLPNVVVVDLGTLSPGDHELVRQMQQQPGLDRLLMVALGKEAPADNSRLAHETGCSAVLNRPLKIIDFLKLLGA
jgi:signal transduction histidine kinase/CheY-like chemotaxis protein